jgi:hypothetical protein
MATLFFFFNQNKKEKKNNEQSLLERKERGSPAFPFKPFYYHQFLSVFNKCTKKKKKKLKNYIRFVKVFLKCFYFFSFQKQFSEFFICVELDRLLASTMAYAFWISL